MDPNQDLENEEGDMDDPNGYNQIGMEERQLDYE